MITIRDYFWHTDWTCTYGSFVFPCIARCLESRVLYGVMDNDKTDVLCMSYGAAGFLLYITAFAFISDEAASHY